jgi:hypothetical protein
MDNRQQTAIVQLNGSNYPTWKVQCKMLLIKEGVWSIVNETETPPESTDTDRHGKFVARKDKALSIIVLAIDPSLLYLLGDPTDPVQVWKKLQEQFQKTSWANKLTLRRRLNNLKLKDGESMSAHIKSMTEIFQEMSVIGTPMEAEDQVVTLLASLPESYNVMVTALEASATVPAMEVVTERLIHEEMKLKVREDESNEKAMFVRKRRDTRECYYCGEIGHFKRDCPDFKSRQPQRGSSDGKYKGKQRANKAEVKVRAQQLDSSDGESAGFVAEHALNSDTCQKHMNQVWIIDSGATCHMCHDESAFIEMEKLEKPIDITLGDGRTLKAIGRGKVVVKARLKGKSYKQVNLFDVLFVPGLAYNLVSVTRASEAGLITKFYDDICKVINRQSKCIATGRRVGNLFHLDCVLSDYGSHIVETRAECQAMTHVDQWHRRFGHLNIASLKFLLQNQMVDELNFNELEKPSFCEPCLEGKQQRQPFPDSKSMSKRALDLVHSDVCGKFDSQSLGGCLYMVTFIDDCTRYVWSYPLKRKSDVFEKFKEWKAMAERSVGHKLKTFRTDNGGEYTSGEFKKYLQSEGIKHELTVPKNPEQNGVAERVNRTITEMVRCMLADSKLPPKFWAEAMVTATYIRNRCPTTKLHDVTPHEALYQEKPSVGHLRRFGCAAYAHIPQTERKKLDTKTRHCILLGYGMTVKGYRLYDITTCKIIHSRDVKFDEEKNGCISASRDVEFNQPAVEIPVCERTEGEENLETTNTNMLRRSTRLRQQPDYYGEPVLFRASATEKQEPATLSEAKNSVEWNKWEKAINAELNSLRSNNVWELVELPKDRKLIGSKWVFKVKLDADGNVNRHKARLVAQGCSQKYGEDYDETFSPVVRFESLRTLIALSAQQNLKLHQMDVNTAFLNGDLKEEVYMKPPEGVLTQGQEGLVWRLKKSIYGLKQSPRCWNMKLDNQLKSMGFQQLYSDKCLYKYSKDGLLFIAVYVDDIVIAGQSEEMIANVKKKLSDCFEVKDLGPLNHFLGMKVKQFQDYSVWLGQQSLVEDIIAQNRMVDCNPVTTPMEVGVQLEKAQSTDEIKEQKRYQSLVGSLLYLSTVSRPDIAQAVGVLARFCAQPTSAHWASLKRILRYLNGTRGLGIMYRRTEEVSLQAYSDSDWAGDKVDRKSTSGYIAMLANGPISWRSKKQSIVALSTAEAEYVSLSSAAQEVVWLRGLLNELGLTQQTPTIIYEDNQSAIAIAQNPVHHAKTKHIDIKYHHVRQTIADQTITLQYCPSNKMVADMLTKPIAAGLFVTLRTKMGLIAFD